MESKEIEITVFDTRLKISSTFYAEKVSENVFRMLENDIQNTRLTYGTEFETKLNFESKLEIVRITKHSTFLTRRFMLSSQSKDLEFKIFGDEIIKNGGYWQTDFGGIATINLPNDSKITFEEIFKKLNFFPTEIKDEKPVRIGNKKVISQEYPSKVKNSIGTFFLLTLFYIPFIYLLLHWTVSLNISEISFFGWTLFFICLALICWGYLGLTNNDIILFENRLKIINKIPLFKKHISFPLDKIKFIKFRHEWTETFGKKIKPNFLKYFITELIAPFFFPTDYKWIIVNTDREYKIYCFGLEMDYYDNDEPLFENLFNDLAEKGVKVSWTDTSDIYYSQMTKNIENKNSTT